MAIEINVVIYHASPQLWIAQGLEYDIVAEAQTLNELPERFVAKVAAEMASCLDLGLEPLAGLGPAPADFWRVFKEATLTVQFEPPPVRIWDKAQAPRILPTMKLGAPNWNQGPA